MNVVVYVEGPSDAKALEALLRPLIGDNQRDSRMARIVHGGGRDALLMDTPRKAAELLAKDPEAWIFVLLDCEQTSVEMSRTELKERFIAHATRLNLPEERRHRFRVHVLAPELEVLLLAAPEALRERLRTRDSLEGSWRIPVEDQDERRSPRSIVKELFERYRGRPYEPSLDAPWILARASLEQISLACPRHFKPFIVELRTLLEGRELAREPSGIIEGFMFIREIVIENVRGFGSGDRGIKLDLQRPSGGFAGWTVLAGRNGAGKSTFLKAVALTIAGPGVARSLQKSYAGWLHEGAPNSKVVVRLAWGQRDRRADAQAHPSDDLQLGLYWERLQSGVEPKMMPLPGLAKEDQEEAEQGPWAENPAGWFIASYGPFRRLGPTVQDQSEPGPLMEVRLASLFDEEVHLAEALRWLGRVHAERLVLKDRAEKLGQQGQSEQAAESRERAEKLDVLRESVLDLLRQGLLPDNSEVVDFDGEDLWVEQGDLRLPLRELSDGYRTVTALVFDIVRQLHHGFGELVVDKSKGFPRVMHEGVVLIDEIEAHMHISWQKQIGFWLKKHFPCIQFIVTTHSPFICQAADERGLIRLAAPGKGPAAEHVSDEDFKTIVNGGADDAALTALFGLEHAHSELSEQRRVRVAELEAKVIRGTANSEERTELEQRSAELPDTGSALVEQALRKLEALR